MATNRTEIDKAQAKSNAPRETVTVTDNSNGRSVELPMLSGTIGPKVIDIRRLYSDLGHFTFDPGYTATGSCESKITYIDGDKGVLLYRGYPIEELAETSDFMEVAYLLLYGELPTAAQKVKFERDITLHTMVHEQLTAFYRGFRRDAHPMAVMCGVVGALSAFYHDSTDISDPRQRMIASYRLIAKMPTIAAMAYKYTLGQPFIYPQNDLGYAENFLHMTFAVPCEEYKVNPVLARAMDRIFILHADHEQNASTSTVRLAGSSGANPFACIAAGIASLWGPAHGGANEAVLKMLMQIGSKDRIPEFIKRAKDKNDNFKLMGFGHRVYKNYDPRAAGAAARVPRGAGRARHPRRAAARPRDGARAHRAAGRVFRREEALSQRRFLFGHHPEGDGLPDLDVHRAVRHRPHRRLGRAVERDDRGPRRSAGRASSIPAPSGANTSRSTSGNSAARHSGALDQLDLVAVGVLDEGDVGGAELQRAGRARDLDAFLGQARAHAIEVGHADREMAEAGADARRAPFGPSYR